jgi:ubiquinone biosynthesis protein UbiJ
MSNDTEVQSYARSGDRVIEQLRVDFNEHIVEEREHRIREEVKDEMVVQNLSALKEEIRGLKEYVGTLKTELGTQIGSEFRHYFGDMTAAKHANEHSRLESLLNRIDKLSDNFWGKVIGEVVKWAVGIFLIGYFVWTQKGGS